MSRPPAFARLSRYALVGALALGGGCDDALTPNPPLDPVRTVGFAESNGVMWFYSTANGVTFDDLRADLDELAASGIRVIGIYSPYDGEVEQWLGAAPKDFYQTPPQCGDVDAFVALLEAAHARDMKVVGFMGFHSIDEDSEFFQTAEAQYAAGDLTSREVASFHWSDTDTTPLPVPQPDGPTAWKFSATAGAYYWSIWDNAGLDINQEGGQAEIERAIRFWMDLGLDGFMLDSGVVHEEFVHLWTEVPREYTSDPWITFESTSSEAWESYDEFGLTSWFALDDNDFANTYSLVVMPEDGDEKIDMEELEQFLSVADDARSKGKTTHAWSPLERAYPSEDMIVQEAALLAGAGIVYGSADYHESYLGWPEGVRTRWGQVLRAVNENAALHPSASRARVPVAQGNAYAMLRGAADGSQLALLVFNFDDAAQDVEVDLAASGVATRQQPIDLAFGTTIAEIDGASYTVPLPAFGFAVLQVAPPP